MRRFYIIITKTDLQIHVSIEYLELEPSKFNIAFLVYVVCTWTKWWQYHRDNNFIEIQFSLNCW